MILEGGLIVLSEVDGGQERRRGAYGVDAPYALFGLACGAVGSSLAVIGTLLGPGRGWAWVPFLCALVMAVALVLYAHATRRGKFTVWEGLLDELELRGDERLLDLGCGRGAVLLAGARRLPEGRAVGVDLWRGVDQSGNARSVTSRNAEAEGVHDRVELHTGDLRDLPFGDGEFDVVLSSLAIHNIKDAGERRRAIAEAVRVLRPGGRLVIVDIGRSVVLYRDVLGELPVSGLGVRSLGWRMWWGFPWMRSRVVTASGRGA
ncbi:Methyltransferase domain-containing protein [Streptomyces sp. KS_16]|nr:methyltransferase family protein [Streptomyces sp. 2321.6]SDR04796.1 Methyltransferase domain-containing protein [Streptomyces sp. KS_16]SED80341.1 Methyltransferase domain-containing protein [Streptomyces sp. 2133.1]SNC72710.1 Methyltransferase domain-containing protein [Streptomyces sp. 2114.4]